MLGFRVKGLGVGVTMQAVVNRKVKNIVMFHMQSPVPSGIVANTLL